MNELRNSKSDDQLEELLLLTEQMQEELDQKDRTIRELKMQLDESLTLNERLNSENRAGNIQALKNDLRKTKELLQSEKEKTHAAEIMTEECQDKLRQAEQERDYALSHQKKVEIPVEKPVLYQKCQNCNQTAYLKAKERYDTQREKLAGRYKAKTVMYEALIFLLIWYSVSTTLFQMIRSKIFISDCVVFFDTIATFVQTIAGGDYTSSKEHGNSYLLWELDKDSIANQSAISLIIRATGICWNQVVCKGMAGNKGILLKIRL